MTRSGSRTAKCCTISCRPEAETARVQSGVSGFCDPRFESRSLQRRVHQTSRATLQTRGVGSPREWVFVHKWLLERKRSYLTEKGLFSRKAVKGDATEPINFIKEESHGTRSTPHRHRT